MAALLTTNISFHIANDGILARLCSINNVCEASVIAVLEHILVHLLVSQEAPVGSIDVGTVVLCNIIVTLSYICVLETI